MSGMSGASIWLEVGPWEWRPLVITAAGPVFHLGFFGLGLSGHALGAWIEAWHSRLRPLAGREP